MATGARTGRGAGTSRVTLGQAIGFKGAALLALATVILAVPARAQELTQRVQLRGFGSWAYGNTSSNHYLSGVPEGNYQHVNFAVNASAALSPQVSAVGQVFWKEDQGGGEVELDYAFAEWRFSDALRLRAGKVQHPFGIYTELFDVGTIRPFLNLPQSVYGPSGIVSEGYEGIGLRGSHPMGHGWNIAYDVYGGGLEPEESEGGEHFLRGEPVGDGDLEVEPNRDMLGGRLVLQLPVTGLRVGGSAYTAAYDAEGGTARRTVWGAEFEYLSDRWWLRSEYAREIEPGSKTMDGGYVEIARFLTSHWQVAGRYDRAKIDMVGIDVSAAPSLMAHEDVALGLNYWFTAEFALKSSYHSVHGNRFAGPAGAELSSTIAAGRLERATHLIQAGAQFSF